MAGQDARVYLQSMVSNDVEALQPGRGIYALLLTPKARIVADLEIFDLGDELVLAAPAERRDDVLAALIRSRFRRKVDVEPSAHAVVWRPQGRCLATIETPAGTDGLVAAVPEAREPLDAWEVARVEAGMPRFGREFDADSMPAEAGLEERAISFTKGCYPGQEPVARLHYRGHANRGLRGLRFADGQLPAVGAAVRAGDRDVGRVGTAVVSPAYGPIALAILRREVPDGAEVDAGGVAGRAESVPFRG
jgi:tRNA-modifying protein YgfZ